MSTYHNGREGIYAFLKVDAQKNRRSRKKAPGINWEIGVDIYTLLYIK